MGGSCVGEGAEEKKWDGLEQFTDRKIAWVDSASLVQHLVVALE